MKKSIFFAVLAAILGFTFTSCKEDTQPRLEKPTDFVLNIPPMVDQMYILQPGGTMYFTVSQPNYGLATTPQYQLEVSDTEDFTNFQKVEAITTDARMAIPEDKIALAVCALYGYEQEADFDDSVRTLYFRVRATVPFCDYADIVSNVVEFKYVKPYFAVKVQDWIWLVGACEGWETQEKPEWGLQETEPESGVYKGTFVIPAGEFQFRFYDKFDADESWEWFSIGSQDEDNPVDIALNGDGLYEGNLVYDFETKQAGKGSWRIDGWPGGTVDITVNLKTKKVSFQKVD